MRVRKNFPAEVIHRKLLQDCEVSPLVFVNIAFRIGILSLRISCFKILREMLIQITVAK